MLLRIILALTIVGGFHAPADAYSITLVTVPGASSVTPNGINAGWEIIGSSDIGPFLYDGGVLSFVSFPGSFASVFLQGINSSGQIVGWGPTIKSSEPNSFLDTNGVFTSISVPTALGTSANSINDSGEIVGSYVTPTTGIAGFLDDGGVYSPINVPGAFSTIPFGINDSGEIVGDYTSELSGGAFVDSGGVFSALNFPGAQATWATGINNLGWITGYYQTYAGGPANGFVDIGGSFFTIDIAGAGNTSIRGISGDEAVGCYSSDLFSCDTGFEINLSQFAAPEPSSRLGCAIASALLIVWARRKYKARA